MSEPTFFEAGKTYWDRSGKYVDLEYTISDIHTLVDGSKHAVAIAHQTPKPKPDYLSGYWLKHWDQWSKEDWFIEVLIERDWEEGWVKE